MTETNGDMVYLRESRKQEDEPPHVFRIRTYIRAGNDRSFSEQHKGNAPSVMLAVNWSALPVCFVSRSWLMVCGSEFVLE